jgi:mannose/fructose/N-acetylgalactosamine-specific phosphotransferase system component IIB
MGSAASEERPAGDPARPGSAGENRSYALFRIDDRLLHGQVALGWGRALHPSCFLLADDRLGGDPGAAELYQASAPVGTRVLVHPLEEVLQGKTEAHERSGTILLVRGIEEAARLLRGGVPGPLNLGGLHLHPGARRILPYLFLSPEEERCLRELQALGVVLYAQDLPSNPREPAGRWLAAGNC